MKADSTKRATWSTFAEAVAAYNNRDDSHYDGIGYCVDHEGGEVLTMVDLDHVVTWKNEKPESLWPIAKDAAAMLDSYTELSVSGTGIHIFAFGAKPPGRCKKAGFEMYDHSRFFTFTGRKLGSTPGTIEERSEQILAVHAKYLAMEPIEKSSSSSMPDESPTTATSPPMSDEEVLAHCRKEKHAEKFAALYDRGEGEGGTSENDFALIGKLQFYTQKVEQIDRLMRGSALVRPKWDTKRAGDTWLVYSIKNALKAGGEVYEGPGPKPRIGSSRATSSTKKVKVTWRRGGDLDRTPISYLVEGLVPERMFGAIAGRDGRGKSLLGMEIAKCVLTGEKLFGCFPVKQGSVYLMLLDDPEHVVSERLDALGILNHPNLHVATANDVDLKDKPGMLAYLKETLPALNPTWVLIDALYKFFPEGGSGDQANSASAMGPVMEAFDEIAVAITGTLCVVAHDNKAGSDVQGSQSIRNMFKWIVRLVLPPEFEKKREEGVLTQQRVMQLNKIKTGRPTSWHLEVGPPGEWVFQGDSAAHRKKSLEERILVDTFDHGASTLEELVDALKARKAEVREACFRLVTAGKLVTGTRERANGRPGRGSVTYGWPEVGPTKAPAKATPRGSQGSLGLSG